MNPYITQVAPYFQQDQGLMPVFQNINAQQQFENMQAQQGNQLTQQAGQLQPTNMGKGFNPVDMAKALCGQNPGMMGTGQTPNWQNPYANYDQSGGINYGAGSTGGTGIE